MIFSRLLLILAVISIADCSNLINTGKYKTINLPISNNLESNSIHPNPVTTNNSESSLLQQNLINNQNNTKIIKEQRDNGNIVQIKVNNNRVPDYYIYPSQQAKLNINNGPDKNVATPSWQINW